MATDDERKFDIRTIDRRLDDGEVSQDEYDEYLDDLPDVSDNAVEFEAEFEEDVLEDDEDDELEAEGDDEDADDAEAEEEADEDEDEDDE